MGEKGRNHSILRQNYNTDRRRFSLYTNAFRGHRKTKSNANYNTNYNKDGGKLYHLDPDCTSIASRYRPLKSSFTYKDINKSPYNKLKPCTKCNAPERP